MEIDYVNQLWIHSITKKERANNHIHISWDALPLLVANTYIWYKNMDVFQGRFHLMLIYEFLQILGSAE